MIGIITHHGHAFRVDTADWGHHADDGDKAGWCLAEWLQSLTADDTATLHALLSDCDEWPSPRWTPAERALWNRYDEACIAARDVGFDGWATTPAFGHNCGLAAA